MRSVPSLTKLGPKPTKSDPLKDKDGDTELPIIIGRAYWVGCISVIGAVGASVL